MTEVTEAMEREGVTAFNAFAGLGFGPALRRAYLAMEAARVPAPAPDVVERVARAISTKVYATASGSEDCGEWDDMDDYITDIYRDAAFAALSAIPIPATGEVEKLRLQMLTEKAVRYSEALESIVKLGGGVFEPALNIARATLTDHTTKGAE